MDPDQTAPTGAVGSWSTLFVYEANIVDPDQTAHTGAVGSWSTLFVYEASNILVDYKNYTFCDYAL